MPHKFLYHSRQGLPWLGSNTFFPILASILSYWVWTTNFKNFRILCVEFDFTQFILISKNKLLDDYVLKIFNFKIIIELLLILPKLCKNSLLCTLHMLCATQNVLPFLDFSRLPTILYPMRSISCFTNSAVPCTQHSCESVHPEQQTPV